MKREELTQRIYKNRALCTALRLVDAVSVILCATLLLTVLVSDFIDSDYYSIVATALTLGVPFVFVSLLRRILSFPRPFEIYDFGIDIKHKGGSFPSRHAYSAFAIGTYLSFVNMTLGVTVLLLGVVISAVRVLLGLHFVRDVFAGGAIGITGALIGAFVF